MILHLDIRTCASLMSLVVGVMMIACLSSECTAVINFASTLVLDWWCLVRLLAGPSTLVVVLGLLLASLLLRLPPPPCSLLSVVLPSFCLSLVAPNSCIMSTQISMALGGASSGTKFTENMLFAAGRHEWHSLAVALLSRLQSFTCVDYCGDLVGTHNSHLALCM